ncbi:MAG: hypothetical protein LBG67_00135 [Campylobacteraceae bacterium]|jgi:hypothetical protein|nr:hypothetical protein [Campylobacteraceae bacterium]
MRKISIVSALCTLFFYGCSGKTQTNPIPKESNVNLPNYEFSLKNGVGSTAELDEFVKSTLTPSHRNSDEPKDIWEIGKEINDRGKI